MSMSWCTVLHCLIPPSLPLFLTLYHLVPDTMALVTCPYHPGQQTAKCLQTDMIMTDVTSPGLWPPCLTSSSSLFFRSSHSHGGGGFGYSQGSDMTHRQTEIGGGSCFGEGEYQQTQTGSCFGPTKCLLVSCYETQV